LEKVILFNTPSENNFFSAISIHTKAGFYFRLHPWQVLVKPQCRFSASGHTEGRVFLPGQTKAGFHIQDVKDLFCTVRLIVNLENLNK